MITCPECDAVGLKSRLRETEKIKTNGPAIKFYDEDGNFHNHDSRVTLTPIYCSNGHAFHHREIERCPTCLVQVDPSEQDEFGGPK